MGKTKKCSRCKEEKPIELFHKAAHHKDGLSSNCKPCVKEFGAAHYQKNKERCDKVRAEWLANNKDKVRAAAAARRALKADVIRIKHKEWRDRNKDRVREIRAEWRANNIDKVREMAEEFRRRNLHKYAAKTAKRRAQKNFATPSWGNDFFIEEIYDLARLRTQITGFEWHVDHIVPLLSKTVCGLHVESNLRVIPGIENIKKGNRFCPN